jgi:hypothetical protein
MKTPAYVTRALLISASLIAALMVCPALVAQESAPAEVQPHSLYISILDGEGALNDIRERTAREPIVEIQDENHKPVAGALVLFAVDNPGSGSPFATFNGASTLSVQTDAAGRAVGQGFNVGRRRGQFKVHVRASKGQAVAEAVFVETNVLSLLEQKGAEPGARAGIFSHKKLDWLLGSAAAGGIVAGLLIALNQNSQTTITTGTGTVGAPASAPGIRIPFGRPGH